MNYYHSIVTYTKNRTFFVTFVNLDTCTLIKDKIVGRETKYPTTLHKNRLIKKVVASSPEFYDIKQMADWVKGYISNNFETPYTLTGDLYPKDGHIYYKKVYITNQ